MITKYFAYLLYVLDTCLMNFTQIEVMLMSVLYFSIKRSITVHFSKSVILLLVVDFLAILIITDIKFMYDL